MRVVVTGASGNVGTSVLEALGREDRVKEIVGESAEFAQNSPEPDPSELYTDVYVEAQAAE